MKIGTFQFNNLISNPIHFLLIDLRSENKSPHFTKAQTVDLANVKSFVQGQSAPKDAAIVVICEDGIKSLQAEKILEKSGYLNVVILDGGTKTLGA